MDAQAVCIAFVFGARVVVVTDLRRDDTATRVRVADAYLAVVYVVADFWVDLRSVAVHPGARHACLDAGTASGGALTCELRINVRDAVALVPSPSTAFIVTHNSTYTLSRRPVVNAPDRGPRMRTGAERPCPKRQIRPIIDSPIATIRTIRERFSADEHIGASL